MNELDEKIAALLAGLDHPEKPKIRAAADALIALSADAPAVKAVLEQSLRGAQHRNSWAVAYVLGRLPQPSGATVRALFDALDHRDPDIRWAIALSLVRMAGTETSLVNLLLELCRGGTVNQKRMAIYCIRDLHLNDDGSARALLTAAQDENATVRVAAVTSLRTRSDLDAAARRRLLEIFLTDAETRVRNASAITLAQLGSPSEDFVTALRAAESSADAALKKAVGAALSLLENKRVGK